MTLTWPTYLIYLAVMAGVTYLIRMLPLTVFRKEIKSVFIKSFLHYVPYAVLAAMTIPGVLYSTDNPLSDADNVTSLITAAAGLVVAIVMAWRGHGLLTVAIAACCGVAAAQSLLMLI